MKLRRTKTSRDEPKGFSRGGGTESLKISTKATESFQLNSEHVKPNSQKMSYHFCRKKHSKAGISSWMVGSAIKKKRFCIKF